MIDDRQLFDIKNIISSYFSLLKKANTISESSVLHFDLSIEATVCKEMMTQAFHEARGAHLINPGGFF